MTNLRVGALGASFDLRNNAACRKRPFAMHADSIDINSIDPADINIVLG